MTDRPINVLHTLSDLHVGGVAHLLMQNVRALNSGRINSTVCYFAPRHDMLDAYREAGIDPVCLDHGKRRQTFRTLWRFIKLIRSLNIDVIHANHLMDRTYAIIAGRILNIPVVITLHDLYPKRLATQGIGKVRVPAISLLDRVSVKHYIAVSKAVKEFHVAEYGKPGKKITVVYSGLNDLARFSERADDDRSYIQSELGLADSSPVLLNVGRLQTVKGQIHLVRMMPSVLEKWANAHLLIVGEGPERKNIEDAISAEKMGDHITLLGQRADVPQLLNSSDVFVFPSLNEALGLSVIEAMATGLPVVAADFGGLRELVRNGETGLLVTPADPEALAKGVLAVLDSPEMGRAYGARGQQVVMDEFDVSRTVAELEAVYEAHARKR